MKLYGSAICVVLLLAVASVGSASELGFSARSAGMGGTGIADTQDAGSTFYNPAGLPWLQAPPAPDSMWGVQGLGVWETGSDWGFKAAAVAGANPDSGWGLGAFYADDDWDNWWGLGAGKKFGETWSLGAGMLKEDETVFNAGLIYQLALPNPGVISLGLFVMDITDEWGGPIYNVGACMPLGETARLAVDVWDLTDEWDTTVNVGAEAIVAPDWCVRAGSMDGDMTFGAGYQGDGWTLDAAYVDWDYGDASILIGGTIALQ